jgi:twitching motility protein PilT
VVRSQEGTKGSNLATLSQYLKLVVQQGGSDLHLKVGHPPVIRVHGELLPAEATELKPADIEKIARDIMPETLVAAFESTGGADFAHYVKDLGRFRVNVFRQNGVVGAVFRLVLPAPSKFDVLNLPPSVPRIASEPRGLILVCGPTGSGKTTTCAAMIDHINTSRACNIVTLEDPVEILHTDKLALVNQREVGSDTDSFHSGLRHAMRQDPDVIFIGEMRDVETVWAALAASETGHLVISTLHTIDAMETVNRIVEFFPEERHRQVRHSLASALRGVVAQRLLPQKDGKGLVPAVEVLVTNGRIHEAILDPAETRTIPDIIAEGEFYGMQTFDQALLKMYEEDKVSLEDALNAASNPHDLHLAMRKAGVA